MALNRRLALLRTTAFPTFRVTVYPTRIAALSCPAITLVGVRSACNTKPGVTFLRPLPAILRKSARCFSRVTSAVIESKRIDVCVVSSAGAQVRRDRRPKTCAYGNRGAACAQDYSAERCASLVKLRGLPPIRGGPERRRCIRSRSDQVNCKEWLWAPTGSPLQPTPARWWGRNHENLAGSATG